MLKATLLFLISVSLNMCTFSQIKSEMAEKGLVLIENRQNYLFFNIKSIKEFKLADKSYMLGKGGRQYEKMVCKDSLAFNEMKKYRRKAVITSVVGVLGLISSAYFIYSLYPRFDENDVRIEQNKSYQQISGASFGVLITCSIIIGNSKVRNIKKAGKNYELYINETIFY